MAFISKILKEQGLKQYNRHYCLILEKRHTKTYLEKTVCSCTKFKPDLSKTRFKILIKLTELFEAGLGNCVINIARSAVSCFSEVTEGLKLGSAPQIKRFMRGLYIKRPYLPKYSHTWNTAVLFSNLKDHVTS